MEDEKTKESMKRAATSASLDNRERVALTESSISKLNAWIERLTAKRPGVTINRKQLVNWLVEAHDEGLSSSEEETLSALFYDEVKFLAHALSRMKEARARGEELSLESVMGAQLSPKSAKKPRAAKKNPDQEATSEPSARDSQKVA